MAQGQVAALLERLARIEQRVETLEGLEGLEGVEGKEPRMDSAERRALRAQVVRPFPVPPAQRARPSDGLPALSTPPFLAPGRRTISLTDSPEPTDPDQPFVTKAQARRWIACHTGQRPAAIEKRWLPATLATPRVAFAEATRRSVYPSGVPFTGCAVSLCACQALLSASIG
ncbi:MAG TPA: hypothetical protein VKQ36_01410 [Ktedonobacterales bacterium]|nr:hypothetical protein [Ktedonobacterales bacterium]